MTEHFLKGFEKQAQEIEKKAVVATLANLGANAIRVLSKPIMAAVKNPGKALTVGFGVNDVVAGAKAGMRNANAGRGAVIGNRYAKATF